MAEPLASLRADIHRLADPAKAKFLQKYFKTGPGEYAEGDVFWGLTVPQSRHLIRQYKHLPLSDITKLLKSPVHEERLIALLIMVAQFSKNPRPVYDLYLQSTKYINNWDLVDLSAPNIIGEYLLDKPIGVLFKLAMSKNLWERRIAIMATFAFIATRKIPVIRPGDEASDLGRSPTAKTLRPSGRELFIYQGNPQPTLQISEILLSDKHDLIHKAVGWMLREVGKRISQDAEETLLKKHYTVMPRTMLRYAIERFPEKLRVKYLTGQI